MEKLFIGVDPGLNGGIVVLDENGTIIEVSEIPKIGKEAHLPALNEIFLKYKDKNAHVILEQVHALFGVAAGTTFTFGMIYGILHGMIVANGFKYTLVQPKTWQKEMFAGILEIRKPSKTNKNGKVVTGRVDTKLMAQQAQVRLFPNAKGFTTDRGKFLDGVTDAVLIAEYGRRKLK